jgi:hypothetical protein
MAGILSNEFSGLKIKPHPKEQKEVSQVNYEIGDHVRNLLTGQEGEVTSNGITIIYSKRCIEVMPDDASSSQPQYWPVDKLKKIEKS